ncbi:MAG: hypothetical protein ACP5OS_01620 [Leptospirillia bacterium]
MDGQESPEGSPNAATSAREFLLRISSLYEFLFFGGDPVPLTLSRVEEMDLSPLLAAQESLDRAGTEALNSLPLSDLLTLSHRIEAISRALAPFAEENGPLASRIAALTGQGPEGAYRKASRGSEKLFGQKILGRG